MEELIEEAKKGNKDAFTNLVIGIENDLYKIAKTRISNEADIDDAVQETIIEAYKNIRKLKEPQKFKKWIITILVNKCNKIYKRKYKKDISMDEYDLDKYIFTAEQKAELKETGRLLFPMKDFTYIFTSKIFDSAQQNLLLQEKQPIQCPLYLLQGTEDKNVLPDKPMQIMQHVESQQVVIKLIKGGNHRLGRNIDILEMNQAMLSLLKL